MIAARLGRTAIGRAALETRSRWKTFALSVVLGAATVLAAVGLLTASGYLISRAAERPEILSLTVAIVAVRFFGISRALLRYGERLASHDLAFRTLTDLRSRFFDRLVPLVPGGIDQARKGDLLSRFVGDVDRLQDLYLRGLAPPLIAIVSSLVCVAIAAVILPVAGLALAVMLLLGAIASPALTRWASRTAGRRQAAARSGLSVDLLEIANGGAEIAVAGREDDWLERVDGSNREVARLQRRDAVNGGLAVGLTTFLSVAAAVAVTAAAIPAVADGQVNGVLLAALALLAMASFEAILPLGQAAAGIDACGEAASRLEEITGRRPPVAEPAAPQPLPPGGVLRFERVGFSYGSGAADRSDGAAPVLADLDFEFGQGEAVALTGPSGIGKSTLAELMVRFRDPTAGRITLGGVDLREFDGAALREAVRLAPQDAYLFDSTIRQNVAIGRAGVDGERIVAALGEAGLEDWINELPDGIDTFVGEGGARVSGGQRQRIAAARVFISRARFLVFDEPTAHIDPDGAAALERRLAGRAGSGCGVLVVTHEISDPGNFDRVLELDRGVVRELRPG
ncbi:MAG: thiol reductant ABC exporter subunit CydC [Solirubrobacterales bacterium]|nr:thiol reductant ABC exporter subunit CydC [Solirubrobacterales bacterium]